MKKNLIPILLFVITMPFMVDAKEYCKVVSGNGKDIGSEIACGTEHFYIIDSNKDEVKMLAKYNLLTGITIYKEKLEEGQTCEELAASKGGTVKSDGFYSVSGYCFYSIPLNDNIIQQSEEAKSAHWDEDENYLYPQVGDVYISPVTRASDRVKSYELHENPVQENTNFYDYDMNFGFSSSSELYHDPYTILQIYKNELESSSFTIKEIDMLSISELDKIINTISQKSLPLKEWGDNLEIVQGQYENNGILYGTEIHFGDLKPYIPNNYKWLYSTTYWNSTVFNDSSPPSPPHHYTYRNTYFVFTAEQGKLCGAGFQTCAPETTLGCGIRPVITISSEDIVEPRREVIVNPETASITILVLVGLCCLLFIGRKIIKRLS